MKLKDLLVEAEDVDVGKTEIVGDESLEGAISILNVFFKKNNINHTLEVANDDGDVLNFGDYIDPRDEDEDEDVHNVILDGKQKRFYDDLNDLLTHMQGIIPGFKSEFNDTTSGAHADIVISYKK